MDHWTLSRQITVILIGLSILFSSLATKGLLAESRPTKIQLFANTADADARMIAVGIKSIVNMRIEEIEIETIWNESQNDALKPVLQQGMDLGLVDENYSDDFEIENGLRAVLKFWDVGGNVDQSKSNEDPGILLVARRSIPSDTIQAILAAIMDDDFILKAANVDIGRLTPTIAMRNLPLRLHQGAEDFLKTRGSAPTMILAKSEEGGKQDTSDAVDVVDIDVPSAPIDGVLNVNSLSKHPLLNSGKRAAHSKANVPDNGQTFSVYFDTADTNLDRQDFELIADACRFAAKFPRTSFIISGHTDTVGSSSFNETLAELRALKVANAIRSDPRFRESLSVVKFGESSLAVPTGDGVPEPMNRRVEITVRPSH